jgi:hypothetical protein
LIDGANVAGHSARAYNLRAWGNGLVGFLRDLLQKTQWSRSEGSASFFVSSPKKGRLCVADRSGRIQRLLTKQEQCVELGSVGELDIGLRANRRGIGLLTGPWTVVNVPT